MDLNHRFTDPDNPPKPLEFIFLREDRNYLKHSMVYLTIAENIGN